MVVWLRKCVHNVVVAVGFHVVVLCFYEVVLFYPDKLGAFKVVFQLFLAQVSRGGILYHGP